MWEFHVKALPSRFLLGRFHLWVCWQKLLYFGVLWWRRCVHPSFELSQRLFYCFCEFLLVKYAGWKVKERLRGGRFMHGHYYCCCRKQPINIYCRWMASWVPEFCGQFSSKNRRWLNETRYFMFSTFEFRNKSWFLFLPSNVSLVSELWTWFKR